MKEDEISHAFNRRSRLADASKVDTTPFSPSIASSVRIFHQSIPGYEPTPLVPFEFLADELKVTQIWVKDESCRFSLNAFKVLGASYAIARSLARKFGINPERLNFDSLLSDSFREKLRDTTVVTATDGNHGRAVAWIAALLGCRAVVYMPHGSCRVRFEAIEQHGAETSIIDGNYDDAVFLARVKAEENSWMLVQDSSWEGYTEIPTWIMQGYLTLVHEALEQLRGEEPTHVFVQCGVGSFAASIQAFLNERFGEKRPMFAVVEPSGAACFYESMRDYDGIPKKVKGELKTIMAGLACGEPSVLAWEILRDYADVFFACPDHITKTGMQLLGNPHGGDQRIVSGESGAVTLGLLAFLRTHLLGAEIAEAVKLDRHSKVLLISTEGDTDPEMYKKILGENKSSL